MSEGCGRVISPTTKGYPMDEFTMVIDEDDFYSFIDHEATYEGSCDDPSGEAWAESQLAYWG